MIMLDTWFQFYENKLDIWFCYKLYFKDKILIIHIEGQIEGYKLTDTFYVKIHITKHKVNSYYSF